LILYHGSKEIAEGLLPSFASRYTLNLMLLLLQDITDKIASPFYRTHHFA
jgi:hypothetical protein